MLRTQDPSLKRFHNMKVIDLIRKLNDYGLVDELVQLEEILDKLNDANPMKLTRSNAFICDDQANYRECFTELGLERRDHSSNYQDYA